jgi:hypothetical protein
MPIDSLKCYLRHKYVYLKCAFKLCCDFWVRFKVVPPGTLAGQEFTVVILENLLCDFSFGQRFGGRNDPRRAADGSTTRLRFIFPSATSAPVAQGMSNGCVGRGGQLGFCLFCVCG